jgi:hypothetical protein
MDRKSNSRIGIVGVFVATVMFIGASTSFGAVTNSFFDTTSQLDGWEYSENLGVFWSSESLSIDGTGSAMLLQSDDASPSLLWQRFLLEDDSETLTFNIRTPQSGISETDYLSIGLFDDSDTSLLGNANGFFQWNSDEGIYDGADEVNVDSVDIANGFVLHSFTVPVSLWVNDYVTLRFTLDSNPEDNFDTTVLVDDVVLHSTSTTPPVVPVPSAVGLALAGLAALGIFSRKLV